MIEVRYKSLVHAIGEVGRLLAGLPDPDAPMRLRVVAAKTDQIPFTCIRWCARVFGPGEPIVRVPGAVYPKAKLIERWLMASQVPAFLEELSTRNHVSVESEVLDCGKIEPSPEGKTLPGFNDFSELPGSQVDFKTALQFQSDSSFLLSFGLPYYQRLSEAVAHWTSLPDAGSKTWIGTGSLFVPHCGPRILRISREVEGVRIVISRPPGDSRALRIQGSAMTGYAWESFGVAVEGEGAFVPTPLETQAMEFHLIDKASDSLDHHGEGPRWHWGHPPVLRDPIVEVHAIPIQEALAHGEGQRVEFKPLVEPASQKMDEVVETVVAFLNTEGGRIYFGIKDDAEVEGIEGGLPGLAKSEAKDQDSREAWYMGKVRKILSDRVAPSAPLEMGVVPFAGRRVLLLSVPRGALGEMYYDLPRRLIFVRRGATNKRADPATDIPEILGRQPEDPSRPF